MGKKFYWINLALILIVVYLAVKNYEEWTSPMPRPKETAEVKAKPTSPSSLLTAAKKGETPPPDNYKVISEKNLFSIERKEFPPPLPPPEPVAKDKVSAPPKPPARPNLTLYGVAIVGEDIRTALISNPTRRADKGERETMTVRVGDKVGEYSVRQILEDRITMESTGDSFDVLLFDPAKQKKRAVVGPAAPPTGPAGKPGEPPRVAPVQPRPVTPASPPTLQPPRPQPTPGTTPSPRDLLRERLERRRLLTGPTTVPQTPTQPVQPTRRLPVPPKQGEDEEEEDDE